MVKNIIVGLTGASGSIYFYQLMQVLAREEIEVHIIASEHGREVFAYETEKNLEEEVQKWQQANTRIFLEKNENLFSKAASGSVPYDGMIILPCSMSTLAEISAGITKSLLTRAADVCMKEKRNLVLVPRETPFSTLHLKNMYELSKMGVTIVPAMPGFYNHPETLFDVVNFIVGKALDALKIENNCYERWKGKED